MNILIIHLKKEEIITVEGTRYLPDGLYSQVLLSNKCLMWWKGVTNDFQDIVVQPIWGQIIEDSVIKESYNLEGDAKLVINLDKVADFIFKDY